MAVWALLPVKNFNEAKTRLSPCLSPDQRAQLAKAMFLDTLSAVAGCSQISRLIVVTNDLEAKRQAIRFGAHCVADPGCGLNPALEAARVFVSNNDRSSDVLVLPSDIPAALTEDLDQLIGEAKNTKAAMIVPDHRKTGTNALLINASSDFRFRFGDNSLQTHIEQAESLGVPMKVWSCASIARDCDIPDDLERLAASDVGPHTRQSLQSIFDETQSGLRLVS